MIEDWRNAGWPVVRIRDIGRLHGGGTPSRRRPEFFSGKIPWITGQDIPESYVAEISIARDFVTEEAIEESATQLVQPGAVLVSTRVTVGKTAIAAIPLCFSQDVTAILIHSPAVALPAYVAHFLRSQREALLQRNQGSTIAGITRDSLALQHIPLPPLSEQKRIVEILQEAEEIRRLNTDAEIKASEFIPALFQDFFGDISSNSKSWPIVPVSSFVDSFQGGKSLSGVEDGFDSSRPRVLKISAVTSGFLAPNESKALPENYNAPDAHFVRPGDLLITRANTEELVGATALVGNNCPANLVLPDKIWRFNWLKSFNGTPEFIWSLFQDKSTRQVLSRIATGTGGSMKNISMKKLMQMRVVWPPEDLQERFTKAVRAALDLHNPEDANRAVASIQASLAAYAFSGQLTDEWREANKEQLATEAWERDFVLKNAETTLPILPQAYVGDEETNINITNNIYAELNSQQRELLAQIQKVANSKEYGQYFTAEQLSTMVNGSLHRHPQAIEVHLAVFAVRGLITSLSRYNFEERQSFAGCYRLPVVDKLRNQGEDATINGDIVVSDIRTRIVERQRELFTRNI
jgi:type I restriction enzyme, S subunit